MSEVLCSRINDNLINLDREYQIVRSDLGKARSKLDDLEPGLADAENRLNALLPSLPERLVGRSPAGRLGSLASSVFDAVATENARANTQGQVDRLRAQVDTTRRQVEALEYQLTDKQWAIGNQQSDFTSNGCFDLGFSHEVMNFPN